MERKIIRNLTCTFASGSLAVAVGVACHRFAPGLGIWLMPMFWPLAALASLVPARYSLAAGFLVPWISFALTGMPVCPLVVPLKFAMLLCMEAMLVSAWRPHWKKR